MKRLLLLLSLALAAARAQALNILCTTADLGWIAAQVGGKDVHVDVVASPDRDPHYLEAKPSYMLKAAKADLVLSDGLELEVGWLPAILRGGRNPKVLPGAPGYLEAADFIVPLEKATGAVSRAEGDVHPNGNPHFLLDPLNAGKVAVGLGARLGALDPANDKAYAQRAEALDADLKAKTAAWQKRVKASGVTQAFTYHKTLVYFFERFGLKNMGNLEPKPGIPPTAAHLLDLAKTAKAQGVKLCLVEHYFDLGAASKLKEAAPELRVAKAVVMGPDLLKVYEDLVLAVEGR